MVKPRAGKFLRYANVTFRTPLTHLAPVGLAKGHLSSGPDQATLESCVHAATGLFDSFAVELKCMSTVERQSLWAPDSAGLSDEGWSGKNLERPAMQELLSLIEGGEVDHLLIWRWDRLSRDQGDFSRLVKVFERCGVKVHSVNEGDLDPTTASGKMQIGVHGVFAQYYRDSIVENVHMGMRQAAEKGRWQNRAPTGYDMVNGELVPNEVAPLVVRVFELRAARNSYPAIEAEAGFKYSTVRHICENRVYLGETRLRDQWFPGNHPPLISVELFDAAGRSHTPGRRRSKDMLSGKARCGLYGRVAGIEYNERNEGIYRCKHRGQGCAQPGRSAKGLLRATVLALWVIKDDQDLQDAIRDELTTHRREITPAGPSVAATITSLKDKISQLLGLYYASKISDDTFAAEEQRLRLQITTLEAEAAARKAESEHREELAERFEEASELLASLALDEIWEEATTEERRTLDRRPGRFGLLLPGPDHGPSAGCSPDTGDPRRGWAPSWYQICCVGGGTLTISDWRLAGWSS